MTFSAVLLFCLGAIAVCAALVFVIETLVAFFVQDQQVQVLPSMLSTTVLPEGKRRRLAQADTDEEGSLDRAA